MSVTDVVLTIDIEFTISGAFAQPGTRKPVGVPSVIGRLGNTELGLGFILDTLNRYGATATFFIETLNTAYFGLGPMGEIARRINAAGHDVQLHLHPCWLTFEDAAALRQAQVKAPNDACGTMDRDALVSLIQRGQRVFADWGLAPPQALRTGGFSVSRHVYAAQGLTNIPLASNICTAVAPPTDPVLQLNCGRHLIDGVVEVPVLSFVDRTWRGRRHFRPLQITACSSAELRRTLASAHQAGLETVVAVTHAFEFFKRRSPFDYADIRENRINQTRLEDMCAFVGGNSACFRWGTFGGLSEKWSRVPAEQQKLVCGNEFLGFFRMAENGLNDRIWHL